MSADGGNSVKEDQLPTDYICMYYEHQYDRMSRLEEQALTVTNILITLSIVAFTFGFDSDLGLTVMTGIGLPFVMVVANLFGIVYIRRTHYDMWRHQLRAKQVLEVYAQHLYQMEKSTVPPRRAKSFTLRRWQIHVLLHALLITAALIPLVLFLIGVI